MKRKVFNYLALNFISPFGIIILLMGILVGPCISKANRNDEVLYLYAIIHNESDFDPTGTTAIDSFGNTGRADLDDNEILLKFTTGYYRKIGKLFQKHGAKINLQSDWTFIDGVKKFDPTFFQEWETMGHENDPHTHENAGTSYPEVYVRLLSAGADASGILGGTLEKGIQERLAYYGKFYPCFYGLWGAAIFRHQKSEEAAGYIWRPSKSESWFKHDPKGKIIYISSRGQRSPNKIKGIKEAYKNRKPNKVNVYCVFAHATFISKVLRGHDPKEYPQVLKDYEPVNFDEWRQILSGIDELKKNQMKIEWESLGELVEIFKKREEEGSLDFSDIDVDNIPRSGH